MIKPAVEPMRMWLKQRALVSTLSAAIGFLLLVGMAGGTAAQQKPMVDSTLAGYVPVARVPGLLTVAGSDSMQPLLIKIAAAFRLYQPDIKIVVEGGGSETAMGRFLEGIALSRTGEGNVTGHEGSRQVFLMASSRELRPTELQQFAARHGYQPTALPIAVDAVAVFVHKDNPVPGLTLEQVDAIFSNTCKRGYPEPIGEWGDLGMTNGWEKAEIHLYGRDQKSGTRAFFREHVLDNGEFKYSVREVPGAASMILAIARDPLGIGYGAIALQGSGTRAVPLAEKSDTPFVTPSAQTAMEGSYPLRRLMYLYVNKPADRPIQPVVMEFLKFVNSREGQEVVARAGFYPIRERQVALNLSAITQSNQ